jgi:hypothetical protein
MRACSVGKMHALTRGSAVRHLSSYGFKVVCGPTAGMSPLKKPTMVRHTRLDSDPKGPTLPPCQALASSVMGGRSVRPTCAKDMAKATDQLHQGNCL